MINAAIALTAFSRPNLLELSIKSILAASGSVDLYKIILWQNNGPERAAISEIIDLYSDSFDAIIQIDGSSRNALQNINFNRILVNSYCFDFLKCDWVLGVEEDTQIGFDAIVFISRMFNKYGKYRHFRGVNLGSIEPNNNFTNDSYSLLRFGPHGQAWAMPSNLWRRFTLTKYLRRCQSEPFDTLFGSYMKTGFVVTPNASRLLDQGWAGTHTVGSESGEFYVKQRSSWVGLDTMKIGEYSHLDIAHTWRQDVKIYRLRDSPTYICKHLVQEFDRIFLGRSLVRLRTFLTH